MAAARPLPTTTIAWRVIHLAAWTDIYRQFAFGDTRPNLNDVDVPGDVSAGLAWLYRAQDDFIAAVDGLSAESAFEPRPAHWGQSVPVVRLVALMLTGQRPPSPIPGPRWWAGPRMTDA
ncbi:MAG: DinB family protein [Acidimicrobiales bacterium]